MTRLSQEELKKENEKLKELLSSVYDTVWVFGLDKTAHSVIRQMNDIKTILEKTS